ncbi:putative isochorismatase family protein, partial [Lachnellula willkommii]
MSKQPKTALLVIDIQDDFETNAASLITSYRHLIAKSSSSPSANKHKIIHVRHASTSPTSPLRPTAPGFAFQAFATPGDGELVITKNVSSAFIGTGLQGVLRAHFAGAAGVGTLFVMGLSADHCVSTSTRMAANLGVCDGDGLGGEREKGEVVLVGDATAAWAEGGWG